MTATTNAAKTAASAATTAVTDERESMRHVQRIGSTDFIVNVRFSQSAKEDLEQKLLRLIESEVSRIA
jgi:hypothetical protein